MSQEDQTVIEDFSHNREVRKLRKRAKQAERLLQ